MGDPVALRKESVDRNRLFRTWAFRSRVALRKESVDRNSETMLPSWARYASLSARRAWIEIQPPQLFARPCLSLSARRAWIEIIDDLEPSSTRKSLSARRAWIEIFCQWYLVGYFGSLSARRAWIEINLSQTFARRWAGRSPQGERG